MGSPQEVICGVATAGMATRVITGVAIMEVAAQVIAGVVAKAQVGSPPVPGKAGATTLTGTQTGRGGVRRWWQAGEELSELCIPGGGAEQIAP